MTHTDELQREHRALAAEYARAQRDCSTVLAAQRAEIERLQAELVRLRGRLIARETALVVEREARGALPPAVVCIAEDEAGQVVARRLPAETGGAPADLPAADTELLEASLVAADLVICQTGCVSHDAYWRVQDHCRRTGKACVLVDAPQAMRWMRRVPAGT